MQWNLFLSSTVRDFKRYRLAVQEACRRKADAACQLSEDIWTGGYDDTVAKCGQRVLEADAFILLAGYWYGSVPPGRDRSITHLEFDHALQRWGQSPFPPMDVMLPEPGSRACRLLRASAARVLAEQGNGFDPDEHDQRLAAFHNTLTGSWRTVKRFRTGPDLREWAISSCLTWKGRGQTFLSVAQGTTPPVAITPAQSPDAQASEEQLGQLGRQTQVQAIRDALAEVCGQPEVPALALIVHGDDEAGQRAFLQSLPGSALKDQGPRQTATRLPVGRSDPALLPAWVAKLLKLPDAGGVDSPEALAERLVPALRAGPRYFLLDRIGDLAGGAVAFREEFWLPLHAKLSQLRTSQPFAHRLVAVVADYGDDPAAWLVASTDPQPPDGAPDYTRLLRVPRLDSFARRDLLAWLHALDVPDQPAGRRAALADRALSNSRGAFDGVPLHVFDRLRTEPLWPEGET